MSNVHALLGGRGEVGAVGKHVLSWSSQRVCQGGAVGECVLS